MEKKLGVVFMGTPEFAAESLRHIAASSHNVLAVVTSPDKPAGRGQKIKQSEVKLEAVRLGIPVLQPAKLKDTDFINELRRINPDVMVVVAFRMLPKEVWALPRLGTFNLHASLLPQYRGAAPINWAIINGEQVTGNTTFFINEEIDKGQLIFQEEMSIEPDETAGELHDRLMFSGAKLVVKTLDALANNAVKPISQPNSLDGEPKGAPKIFKDDCKIVWASSSTKIFNHIRGLSPYPAAWTTLTSSATNEEISAKIFSAHRSSSEISGAPGSIVTDGKTYLQVITGEGSISIEEIQLAGKKRMTIDEFLRGFKNIEIYRFS